MSFEIYPDRASAPTRELSRAAACAPTRVMTREPRRQVRSGPATRDPHAEGWHDVLVRWPGDNSQRMYQRPRDARTWTRRNGGLFVAAALTLGGLLTAATRPGAAAGPIAPTVAATPKAAGSVTLPDYTDAYLARRSLRPAAERRSPPARIDPEDIHGPTR